MTFKEIRYRSPEWEVAVKLRERVLRTPLGSKFTIRELEEEKDHIQIAGFLEQELVATAVLVPEGEMIKMQRVAVKENLRNKGMGSELIEYCEGLARDKNFKWMYCHARDTAIKFYTKNNYAREGAYFDEDGIPHLKMAKWLGPS